MFSPIGGPEIAPQYSYRDKKTNIAATIASSPYQKSSNQQRNNNENTYKIVQSSNNKGKNYITIDNQSSFVNNL